jgi:hypothetical protein
MPRPVSPLGDAHNFGRRVSHRAGRVVKPRSVFWEWLTLGVDSPLRRLLDELAEGAGLGRDTFAFLPKLKFYRARGGIGGEVQRLELEPLPRASAASRRCLAAIVGRSLALWSFLGVADLHWENLILGVDAEGRIVFGPLDVELILADLALPTETKLIPDADPEYRELCRHAAGVRRALPLLGKPVELGDLLTVLHAYDAVMSLLSDHAPRIARVISSLAGFREAPIRVLLRSTADYVAPSPGGLWPPLLDAEAEQLARGDIPYFFRLYGRRGIHYYAERSLQSYKTLPLSADMPKLEPLLDVARGLGAKSRQSLRDAGLFCVLGAFDHPSFRGSHESAGLRVTFGARKLRLLLPGERELEAARDLRAFVSSVYLPCRCGEVRSVFVPARSRCRPRASKWPLASSGIIREKRA